MLVDSHAHLNFKAYAEDLGGVIRRCQDRKMLVVNVGSQINTSREAIGIADNHDGFFTAVGVHPIHLGKSDLDPLELQTHEDMEESDPENMMTELENIINSEKVVAVGEIGLDYFHLSHSPEETKEIQRKYFIYQLDLAIKHDLPVILHARGEKDDPKEVYEEILDTIKGRNLKGVIHCFGSDLQIARKFVDLGFYVGFTGIVTFRKKAEELQEVARELPLENILIETDCPYLSPEPHRGERNEPKNVELVAQKIAELKGIDVEEVIETTGDNAVKLFDLK